MKTYKMLHQPFLFTIQHYEEIEVKNKRDAMYL